MLRFIEELQLNTEVELYYQWEYGDILFEKELKRLSSAINLKWEMVKDINTNFEKPFDVDLLYICGEKRITNPFMDQIKERNLIGLDKIKLEQWF